jgi:hypothetical protein
MAGPLVGAEGDPGLPTINVKTSTACPLGGAGAEDPGVPTINAKERRRWAPWEVLELEIQERPPSMLRNVDDGAPSGC